jgi:hypothetical protein
MGMVVTTVAIKPEPMPSFCAKPMQFMAKNTISPPTSAELRHCSAVGRAWPCHKAMSSMTTPGAQKAHRVHQQRRHGLQRDAGGEIGGAPHHIDQQQGRGNRPNHGNALAH